MTGEQLYRAHKGSAEDMGIDHTLPPWDELDQMQHSLWEELAYEQTLRDRALPNRSKSDRLQSNEKGF